MKEGKWMDLTEYFDSFERVEEITDVILIGIKGGVRRIQLEEAGDEIK